MRIGDEVRRRLDSMRTFERNGVMQSFAGRVVYIHPKGFYFTAEFPVAGGVIRECFNERVTIDERS